MARPCHLHAQSPPENRDSARALPLFSATRLEFQARSVRVHSMFWTTLLYTVRESLQWILC